MPSAEGQAPGLFWRPPVDSEEASQAEHTQDNEEAAAAAY